MIASLCNFGTIPLFSPSSCSDSVVRDRAAFGLRRLLIYQRHTVHSIVMLDASNFQLMLTDLLTSLPRRYEFQDTTDSMKWKRCYGLEDWTFASDGRMAKRQMSGNEIEIGEGERWFVEGVDVDDGRVTERMTEEHW